MGCRGMQRSESDLTPHWSRRPTAFARASLQLSGAAQRQRSGKRRDKPAQW
jgi:hypothetical protein